MYVIYWILVQHIAVHAYANWGQNNYIADPFIRRMSKITVLYNYYGGTCFAENCKFFKALGIFTFDYGHLHSRGFRPSFTLEANSSSIRTPHVRRITKMVAEQKTVKDHTLVIKLKKHSDIVKFILELRLKWRFKILQQTVPARTPWWTLWFDFATSPTFIFWQISNYFLSLKMISMESMGMPSLSEQWYIRLIITWWRNMLNH